MSTTLFNLKSALKEKEITRHPWQNTIKDVYSNNIKTAHNSTNNPFYPVKKEKPVYKNRMKFTVIGNRVTEEFIYCEKMVTGLYAYRKKQFEPPVIRGVTSVEWPLVWHDLKLQYGGLAYCLTSQVAVLVDDKMLGGVNELKELLDSKYNYCFHLNYYKESIKHFAKFIKGTCLYSDIVPFTCENFLRLCKETKGGYSGTLIHRIVKDGWIQCGGFGLKETEFYCENFIVPPDRRGVLCMANAGRHVECSTQFFVLLQPSPWMEHKYVALGQLIDGESTLKQIESVETWYESPTSEIKIERAGILNLECQDIMINRGAKEYIHGHIEDLFIIQAMFLEELMTKVFLEIKFREIARLENEGEGAEASETDDAKQPSGHLHATERFMRKGSKAPKVVDKTASDQKDYSKGQKSHVETKSSSHVTAGESNDDNNDFDVSNYEYEPEEYSYQQGTAPGSLVVPPEMPYYIPLTDIPYPGEVDSNYDLKKFLRGDYCLESDLKITAKPEAPTAFAHKAKICKSDIFRFPMVESPPLSEVSSLDSEEEHELKRYVKLNIDCVSFAGHILRNIVRRSAACAADTYPALLTDEELRRFRIAAADYGPPESQNKKVSISVPIEELKPVHKEIKRRQTGFVHPTDLEKVHVFQKGGSTYDDTMSQRRVRLEDQTGAAPRKIARRPTAFPDRDGARRRPNLSPSDLEVKRQSVLTRLLDDRQAHADDNLPTLKDFKPMSFGTEVKENLLLTRSPNPMKSDEKLDHYRRGFTNDDSIEDTLNLQFGKDDQKISLEYLKPMEKDHKQENSIRSVEYTRIRPSITVAVYQQKNKKYLEELSKRSE